MIASDYQTWLNSKGASLTVDGVPGNLTRQATKDVFVNKNARAVTDRQVGLLSSWLGCSFNQMTAVSVVESSGSGFDEDGRPKQLFERHKFSGFTGHRYDVCSYSNPDPGGYNDDTWEKLTQALCKDVDAAFKSCSWGKFQVMGYWFCNFGLASPVELAYNCVRNEFWHYRLFASYIRMANLESALQQVSTDPDDCRPFAKGYNGPNYEDYDYHIKIANEMQNLQDESDGTLMLVDEFD